MEVSFDTETTGLDLRHGCRPFFFAVGTGDGAEYWEWDVDPLTRMPDPSEADLDEIEERLLGADRVYGQNLKFDVRAVSTVRRGLAACWPWERVFDTLLAGHLLSSSTPHDLTTMVLMYLGVDLLPYEKRLKAAVNEARRWVRSHRPDWRIAQEVLPELPSGGGCGCDYWLPRAVAKAEGYPADHAWWTVLREYALADAESTFALGRYMEEQVEKRGLTKIWNVRRECSRIAYDMETTGVTVNGQRLEELSQEYREESYAAGARCVSIAESYGYELTLPKSGNNQSLLGFVFGPLEAPVLKRSSKTGAPSLDKRVVEALGTHFPPRSKGAAFMRNLVEKRQRDTAVQYMEGYKRFWVPLKESGWYRLYPSLNPTGTTTLRWSSSDPNEQNISKRAGFNLRRCFGPSPGEEWWSFDAKNIELRLPAYEACETEMVALFERPDDPPYFGSYHLLVFSVLHPEMFAEHGADCKDVFASTWYQWTKNGNFAVQYGAVESSGTADAAYHVPGAQRRIQQRFAKIAELNRRQIALAQKRGYVETIPDRTVDPDRGYPLECPFSDSGQALPTVPLNYHIQGTAMWWMLKAMMKVREYLATMRGYRIVLQVHDELVIAMPEGHGSEPWKVNLPVARRIMELMSSCGDDLGIPTPVSCEYHATDWSEGVAV